MSFIQTPGDRHSQRTAVSHAGTRASRPHAGQRQQRRTSISIRSPGPLMMPLPEDDLAWQYQTAASAAITVPMNE